NVLRLVCRAIPLALRAAPFRCKAPQSSRLPTLNQSAGTEFRERFAGRNISRRSGITLDWRSFTDRGASNVVSARLQNVDNQLTFGPYLVACWLCLTDSTVATKL